MTREDHIRKWLVYGAALLAVIAVEYGLLHRLVLFGVMPIVAPLAVVAVAILEGPTAGAACGIVVGVVLDGLCLRTNGLFTFTCFLAGTLSGAVTESRLSRGYAGSFLCCAGTLVLIDGARVLSRLTAGVPLAALARIALPEIGYSLLFALPVYFLFTRVYDWVGGDHLA